MSTEAKELNKFKLCEIKAGWKTEGDVKKFDGFGKLTTASLEDRCNFNSESSSIEEVPSKGYDQHVVVLVGDKNKGFSQALLSKKDSDSKSVQLATLPSDPKSQKEVNEAISDLWRLAGQGLNIVVPGNLGGSEPFPDKTILFTEDFLPSENKYAKAAELDNKLQKQYVDQLRNLQTFLALDSAKRKTKLAAMQKEGEGADPFLKLCAQEYEKAEKARLSIRGESRIPPASFSKEKIEEIKTILQKEGYDFTEGAGLITAKDKETKKTVFTVKPDEIKAEGKVNEVKIYQDMLEAALLTFKIDQKLVINNLPPDEKAKFDQAIKSLSSEQQKRFEYMPAPTTTKELSTKKFSDAVNEISKPCATKEDITPEQKEVMLDIINGEYNNQPGGFSSKMLSGGLEINGIGNTGGSNYKCLSAFCQKASLILDKKLDVTSIDSGFSVNISKDQLQVIKDTCNLSASKGFKAF